MAALNTPKARVECEPEEPRISTSSADSTCKFPGYFRAASARILENTVASEQIAARAILEEWFLLTSVYTISPTIDWWLDATAQYRREEKMGHGLSWNRSLLHSQSLHVTEANPDLSVLWVCKVHSTIELLSYENVNLGHISNRKYGEIT